MAQTALHGQKSQTVYGLDMRFALTFGLTLAILMVEIIAGILSNSLALLSDAGHIVTDVFALGLGWFAAAQAQRPANQRNTWGYHRIGILAALANATTLVVITIFIVIEAFARLHHPMPVNPPLMSGAALLAIAINVINARVLRAPHAHDGHGHVHQHEESDLNQRAALLHIFGDIGASAAVVLGALLIVVTKHTSIDAIISIAIALLLVLGAVRIGRDALNILLEATPRGIDIVQLVQHMETLPGIYSVHHVHVWSITSTMRAISCHVITDDMALSASAPLLAQINQTLHSHFGIDHATVQFEGRGRCQHADDCACGESEDCGCSADPARAH